MADNAQDKYLPRWSCYLCIISFCGPFLRLPLRQGQAPQLLADGRNNSAALLKWSCKGCWLHVGLSHHSLWSSFWIRHAMSGALEMLRSWRTHQVSPEAELPTPGQLQTHTSRSTWLLSHELQGSTAYQVLTFKRCGRCNYFNLLGLGIICYKPTRS